jgi:hypothetical protein
LSQKDVFGKWVNYFVIIGSIEQLLVITYFQESIHTEDYKNVNVQLNAQCVAIFQKSALV